MSTLRYSLASMIVFAVGAQAQNGNDAHPQLIQVGADRPALSVAAPIGLAPVQNLTAVANNDYPEKPAPVVLAPTAFTPDGDGLNDKFFPHLIGMDLGLSRFRVFDRWGRELFASQGQEGWDGTWGSGTTMPQGVYVWHLEAWPMGAADKLEMAGSVTLIR